MLRNPRGGRPVGTEVTSLWYVTHAHGVRPAHHHGTTEGDPADHTGVATFVGTDADARRRWHAEVASGTVLATPAVNEDTATVRTWYVPHAHGASPTHRHEVAGADPDDHIAVRTFRSTAGEALRTWKSSELLRSIRESVPTGPDHADRTEESVDTVVPDNADRPGAAHYAAAVQPIDLIDANDLGFYEGTVIKYVTRWSRKNGVQDLEKAHWYLARLLERARARERETNSDDG